MRFFLLAAAVSSSLAGPAAANDSSAELRTGGLVFVRNDQIEMRSEDLFISMQEVRVRYEFVNTSENDVTTLVAFPMPDVQGGVDLNIVVPVEEGDNFLGFETEVDGKPVAMQMQQRATALGVDQTQRLRDLGVPLAPHSRSTAEALTRLPEAEGDRLVKLGLASVFEYDAGQGWQRERVPIWSLSTTYYWEQTFPAGKTTVVEHRYKPSVGASVGNSLGSPDFRADEWVQAAIKRYCVEDDLIATLDRARAENGDMDAYWESRIDYILTTGANWAGPIGEFHLTIDKGAPENLVSFCAEGVEKTSPTRFEVRATDFVPERDLAILFLLPRENL